MSPSALLDAVVRASRLNRVAPFTVRRLLIRSDVLPDELTPAQLAQALPALERGLAVYLEPEDLRLAITEIRALVQ